VLFVVAHLTIAAVWLGSMAYSLTVVQPKVARFFADEQRREDFLITLAQGNRWKVVPLIAALLLTALGVMLTVHDQAVGYAVVAALYTVATEVFGNVSWRHWPARVFAVPDELPKFRRSLLVQARVMLALVATAFLIGLSVSVRLVKL
jgi:uncharacterized membrane protein